MVRLCLLFRCLFSVFRVYKQTSQRVCCLLISCVIIFCMYVNVLAYTQLFKTTSSCVVVIAAVVMNSDISKSSRIINRAVYVIVGCFSQRTFSRLYIKFALGFSRIALIATHRLRNYYFRMQEVLNMYHRPQANRRCCIL